MANFVSLLASGIAYGCVLALVSLGFLLLYKATGVVNFAHGDLMTTGAYFAIWGVSELRIGTAGSYALALALMFLVGVALERVAYAPLRTRPMTVVVVATLGAAIVIEGLLSLWQGASPRDLASPVGSRTWHVAGAAIAGQRVLIAVVTLVAVTGMLLLFHRTPFGRQVRALAADRETTQLQGVRVRRLSVLAFGLSAVLAGLAGILIAPLGAVNLTLGFNVMLTAFAAAILGGFGSLGGVVVGSLLMGIAQQVLGGYVLTSYSQVWPFLFMLLAIAVRPQGLFTRTSHGRL